MANSPIRRCGNVEPASSTTRSSIPGSGKPSLTKLQVSVPLLGQARAAVSTARVSTVSTLIVSPGLVKDTASVASAIP